MHVDLCWSASHIAVLTWHSSVRKGNILCSIKIFAALLKSSYLHAPETYNSLKFPELSVPSTKQLNSYPVMRNTGWQIKKNISPIANKKLRLENLRISYSHTLYVVFLNPGCSKSWSLAVFDAQWPFSCFFSCRNKRTAEHAVHFMNKSHDWYGPFWTSRWIRPKVYYQYSLLYSVESRTEHFTTGRTVYDCVCDHWNLNLKWPQESSIWIIDLNHFLTESPITLSQKNHIAALKECLSFECNDKNPNPKNMET